MATEDEIVGWHHPLNGHEFEQTLRDSERQGSLMCCNPRGRKESDMTATEQQQQIVIHPLSILKCQVRKSLEI